jgi:Cu2+-exporting ATPase
MQCEIAHSVRGRLRVRYPARWLAARSPAFEARLGQLPGVRAVAGRAVTGSLRISYDPGQLSPRSLVNALDDIAAGLTAGAPAAPRPQPERVAPPDTRLAHVLGAGSVVAAAWLPVPPPLKAGLVVASGLPSLLRAGRDLVRRRRLTGDVLEAMAFALLALRQQWPAAALLTWFRWLGDWVLAQAVRRTRRSLRDLVLRPGQRATRLDRDRQSSVAIDALAVGDVVLVGAGESVPVDGTVVRGEALVNQQTMTGEGLPVERRAGDRVFAGTTVEDGEIAVRADRVGLDTAIGRIVAAIEAAAGERSEIQAFAEELAGRQVGRTLVLAGLGSGLARSVDAGVAILVADYGMAARVGIPTALVAAMTRASQQAILIKGTRALESLARVDTVVFDKTGTLTAGVPQVSRVAAYGPPWGEDEIVGLAAAAERGFPHPVARAITRCATERGVDVPARGQASRGVGLGVDAVIDGRRVLAGSRRFMESQEIALAPAADDEAAAHAMGGSPTFVAVGGRLAGLLVLEDQLRPDARHALRALRARGLGDLVMLSGDHAEPTRVIAESLGVHDYRAELLPEDKAALVRELRDKGRVVAMVGDGVNDALALREADVGIAVRGGPELVAEAADVVLLHAGLDGVVQAIDIARGSIGGIQRMITWAAGANLVVVGLASLGLARPVASILVSRGVTIAAALAATAPTPRRPTGRPRVAS